MSNFEYNNSLGKKNPSEPKTIETVIKKSVVRNFQELNLASFYLNIGIIFRDIFTSGNISLN